MREKFNSTLAGEIVERQSSAMLKHTSKSGLQKDGSWADPAYLAFKIKAEDICPQEANPNYMSSNAFKALQTSIWNNGMAFPVLVSRNPYYDPSTEGQERPRIFTGTQDIVELRDREIRKYFPYTVIDGTHRLMAVLYGSPIYSDLNDKKSQEIYERCGGYIPCTILEDKSEQELMSAEILFNQARGEHSLESMKDIVSELSRSGLSDAWISRNLFLDMEAITRFKQLSGMSAAFNNEEFESEAWDPIKEGVYEKRKNIDLTNAAVRYVRIYRKLQGKEIHDDVSTDIITAAKALGFNADRPNEVPRSLDKNGKIFETEIYGG